jgi:hypothetical protein
VARVFSHHRVQDVARAHHEQQLYPWSGIEIHRHGKRNVALVSCALVRDVPVGTNPALAAAAVAWLETHWRGDVFLPDQLKPERVTRVGRL